MGRLVALAGNPNVGKSTLFNRLTGLKQHTGNWPGKTVELAQGRFTHQGTVTRLVDLPGTYSLSAHSPEEAVTRDFLLSSHPDAVVVLQSLLPVSARQDSKGSYVNNDRIAVYNQILRELADEKACVWLDVGAALADETGCLPADMNTDGVHLNTKGCALWTDYLRTHPVT